MFKWLDTASVDEFADRIVADLVQRLPPSALERGDRKVGNKSEKAYRSVLGKAREFKQTQALNMYKKARLASRLKWSLIDAGYPAGFVNELSYEVAAALSSDALTRA